MSKCCICPGSSCAPTDKPSSGILRNWWLASLHSLQHCRNQSATCRSVHLCMLHWARKSEDGCRLAGSASQNFVLVKAAPMHACATRPCGHGMQQPLTSTNMPLCCGPRCLIHATDMHHRGPCWTRLMLSDLKVTFRV